MSTHRDIALFGTEEPAPKTQRFNVGALSFEMESGGLRHVRFAGTEVIRGIQYLLRDGNWSTPAIDLESPDVEESGKTLRIGFRGHVLKNEIAYSFVAEIRASTDGVLTFRASGRARSAFDANRIGFTVLHPTPECEDIPLTVEHLDGSVEETRFPLEISPGQPVFDIRALRYRVDHVVEVDCRMVSTRPGGRAEPFEMEDHRNWSDASYKTYVGTLLEPFPYRVENGDQFEQEITLTCRTLDNTNTGDSADGLGGIRLARGEGTGNVMPPIGFAVPHEGIQQAVARGEDLAQAKPHHLTAYLRPDDAGLDQDIAALSELGRMLDAQVNLEIELPCEADYSAELGDVARACEKAGLTPESVLACPTAYLQSYQPTAEWPQVPPLETIYEAARKRFPGSRIGGGMLTYFTELNRKWPPRGAIDFVSHTLSPIVHAADDTTVVENLSPLAPMAATVRAHLGDVEHRLGPTAISMRHNPYGNATVPNTANLRTPMGDADPRERGLFAAAWVLGLIAQGATCDLAAMTLFATSGPRSVLYQRGERDQPGFDGVTGTRVRPVFHVLKALSAHRGARYTSLVQVGTHQAALTAFVTDGPLGSTVWAANLGPLPLTLQLDAPHRIGVLDAATFELSCRDPDWSFRDPGHTADTIELDAYAVLQCRPVH